MQVSLALSAVTARIMCVLEMHCLSLLQQYLLYVTVVFFSSGQSLRKCPGFSQPKQRGFLGFGYFRFRSPTSAAPPSRGSRVSLDHAASVLHVLALAARNEE